MRQLGRLDESKAELTEAVRLFRGEIEANQQDDETRAELAMALAALGNCTEALGSLDDVLARHPQSPLLAYYGAITASRCGDDERAAQLIVGAPPSRDVLGSDSIPISRACASVPTSAPRSRASSRACPRRLRASPWES